MKRFCTILVAVLVFTFSADVSITLQECWNKARENYPLVRKYDLIRVTKECNIHNASLSWLPRLELGGGGTWLNNVTDAVDLKDVLGMLGKLLDLSGKQQQPWQLLLEERLKQAEGRVSVLESNLAKMKTIYDEGEVSTMDLESMVAEVMSYRQQIMLIESNIKSSRLSLSLLTSVDLAEEQLITPEEPVILPSRPECAFIESNLRLLELKMKKLDVDLSPKISFVANAYYGYPGRNIFKGLTVL